LSLKIIHLEGLSKKAEEVSYLPSGDDDDGDNSVLQEKLIILANLVGNIGLFVAILTSLIMIIVYIIQVFATREIEVNMPPRVLHYFYCHIYDFWGGFILL
jgi:hypothetical protein